MDKLTYKLRKSLANKVLYPDGSIHTLSGETVQEAIDMNKKAYEYAKAIPNKVLNPDGSISLLSDIIAENSKIDLFIPVVSLPEEGEVNKIYLVPAEEQEEQNRLEEYIWMGDGWEHIGQVNINMNDYMTAEEVEYYVDGEIESAIFQVLEGDY